MSVVSLPLSHIHTSRWCIAAAGVVIVSSFFTSLTHPRRWRSLVYGGIWSKYCQRFGFFFLPLSHIHARRWCMNLGSLGGCKSIVEFLHQGSIQPLSIHVGAFSSGQSWGWWTVVMCTILHRQVSVKGATPGAPGKKNTHTHKKKTTTVGGQGLINTYLSSLRLESVGSAGAGLRPCRRPSGYGVRIKSGRSRVGIPLATGFFRGRVIPVTSKLALQWLPCQAPGVIGSALGLVGTVSVYCDWVR